MPTRDERWPAGTPCWVDLSSPDLDTAKAFYSSLLGWDYREADGGYLLCLVRDREASGLMAQQSPEQVPAWTLYFATDDVDAHAKAITEAGGALLMGPETIGPWGRMAYAQDPTGAAFGLWQADRLLGVRIYNEPGALVWEDAETSDPAAAKAFYSKLFGFTWEQMEGDFDYATFSLGGDPLGGLGQLSSPDATPGWRAYFGVADTDAAVAAALASAGRVVTPAMDTPYGRMARLADPAGAALTVMSTTAG
jgi:predicted enzyme related to lactoylglutathione lyase